VTGNRINPTLKAVSERPPPGERKVSSVFCRHADALPLRLMSLVRGPGDGSYASWRHEEPGDTSRGEDTAGVTGHLS
jgi:hypothetical protein